MKDSFFQTGWIILTSSEYKEEKVYPEKSEGLGGLGFDEHNLLQLATNLHAKTLRETSLKYGKTATYYIPPNKLDCRGPYELTIPSMDTEW